MWKYFLHVWHLLGCLTWMYDPKELASFHSQRWNSDTNPDLAFAHTVDTGIPTRRVLDKFPRSQHRPSLISSPCITAPIACKPVKRWNFRKANCETFKQMTDVATSQLPPPDPADTEDAYKAFCRIMLCIHRCLGYPLRSWRAICEPRTSITMT